MARMTEVTGGGQQTDQHVRVTAEGQDTIAVPDADYIANAEILRDGQDLVLRHPGGGEFVVEGYFSDYPPPALVSPTGSRLTPELVESFVKTAPEAAHYAQAQTATDESPVGTVGETSGTVTVTRTDGTVETLTAGMPVFEGDIIETNAGGAANIQFVDETSFAISSNAKLAIDNYVFDPATSSGESNFSVLRGMFVFVSGLIGRDDPDDVEINTPVGSIGIRGTTIAGNVDTGQITVIEGAIVLRTLDGRAEMTLAAQFETARFNAASGTIDAEGVLDAYAINTQYNAMQNVAPAFFSGIAGPAPADANGSATGSGDMPVAPAPAPEEQAPPAPEALPPAGYNETSFQGDSTTQFEASAETVTSTTTVTETQSTETLLPPPPVGTATDTTLSGSVTTAPAPSTTLAPAPTGTTTTGSTILSPPPTVLNGGTTTTSPGPSIFNLQTIGAADGFRLSGAVAEHFGASIAGVGDYNNDGLADFIVGNNTGGTGTARIFGVGQSLLGSRTINASSDADLDGLGDIDGDGTNDYIIGSGAAIGNAGYIEIVRDGTSTTFMNMGTNYRFGSSVAGVGDINGDGYNDVVAGAPGALTGGGKAIIVFGADGLPTILEFSDTGPGSANGTPDFVDDGHGAVIQGSATLALATDVSAAGDFNNDGYADFIYSTPTDGRVYLATGGDTATGITGTTMIRQITAGNTDIPLFSMGDVNGDGVSDIGLGDRLGDSGRGVFHVMYGAGGGSLELHVPVGGGTFVSAGSAGDFNGDGRDDIAVALRNGDKLDIFVLYGMPGLTGSIALTDALMNDASKGFRMGYSLLGQGLANPTTDGFKIELTSAGDINGDGRDDLLIGAENAASNAGEVIAVYGRGAATGPSATAAGQGIVGTTANDALSDGGFANVSFNGGAGNDTIHIGATGLVGNIDGGAGMDMLRMGATRGVLDFDALGSEKISGIERIVMQGSTQMVRLGIDDIFRLMQESADGILRIDSPNTGNVLSIDDNTGGTTNLTGLGFVPGGTQLENGINYNVHDFNGYSLYIDPTLTVNMV